ncbi:hypothetical protein MRX96_001197 [Rhipicephalus microplus]
MQAGTEYRHSTRTGDATGSEAQPKQRGFRRATGRHLHHCVAEERAEHENASRSHRSERKPQQNWSADEGASARDTTERGGNQGSPWRKPRRQARDASAAGDVPFPPRHAFDETQTRRRALTTDVLRRGQRRFSCSCDGHT